VLAADANENTRNEIHPSINQSIDINNTDYSEDDGDMRITNRILLVMASIR